MSLPLVSGTEISYNFGSTTPDLRQSCTDATGRYVFSVDSHATAPLVARYDLQVPAAPLRNWAVLPTGITYSACYLSIDGLYVVVCSMRGRRFRVAIADPLSIDEIDPILRSGGLALEEDMFLIDRQSASLAYGQPFRGSVGGAWSINLDTGAAVRMPATDVLWHPGRIKNHYHYSWVSSVLSLPGYWGGLAKSGVADFNLHRRDFLGMASYKAIGSLPALTTAGETVTGEDAHRVGQTPLIWCAGCDDGATPGAEPDNIYLRQDTRCYRYNLAEDSLTLVVANFARGYSMTWVPQRNVMWCTTNNSGYLLSPAP